MDKIRVRGYAKINLTLEVVGRREDGYHLLRSVAQSLSLADDVLIERSDRQAFDCDDPNISISQNSLLTAVRFFEKAMGNDCPVAITLQKKIPYQAGLGSASADAAAVLRGLNVLYGYPFTEEMLLRLALQVGADVPFCLTGGTQMFEGIGERLLSLPSLLFCWVLLVKPEVGIDTKEAYRRIDMAKEIKNPDSMAAVAGLYKGDIYAIAKNCGNVFEQVCEMKEVELIKKSLRSNGAIGSSMSGSGSAVFGLFDNLSSAQAAFDFFNAKYPFVHLAQPVGRGTEIFTG